MTLYIFVITDSPPLQLLHKIETEGWIYKILVDNQNLVLGGNYGWLQLFDTNTRSIIKTKQFTEVGDICDIIRLNEHKFHLATQHQYLLATKRGILQINNEFELIKQYKMYSITCIS